jgi:hypothetical protein
MAHGPLDIAVRAAWLVIDLLARLTVLAHEALQRTTNAGPDAGTPAGPAADTAGPAVLPSAA